MVHFLRILIPIVVLFFLSEKNILAQPSVRDSLYQSLLEARTDSVRAYWSARLAWYYLSYDLDSAEYYIQIARSYHHYPEDEQSLVYLSHYQGLAHRLKGEFSAALDSFKQVLAYYESTGDTARMTSPLFNLGVVYSMIGDYDKSLEYYYQELKINQALGLDRSVANSLNSIGNIHKNRGYYGQARRTYRQSLRLVEPTGDHALLATILGNLATVDYLDGALDSAQIRAEQSLAYDRELGRDWGVAHSLFTLGQIARAQNKTEAAEQYFLEAINIRERLGQPIELLETYQAYADLLVEMNRIGDAIPLIQESIGMAETTSFLKGQENGFRLLATAYAKSRNFNGAYQALQKQEVLKDSLFNLEKEKALQELDVQYEVQQKEQALINLAAENEWQKELVSRERSVRMAFTLSTMLFAILLAGAVVWYRQRLEKDRLLREQTEALQDARIRQLAEQEKVNTLNAMISGQEEERKRIASDLHDSLGSLLSSIKLYVRAVLPDREKQKGELNDMLDYASEEVRRIAHHMMPDVLQFGLGAAIADLTHHFNKQDGVQVAHQVMGQEPDDFPDNKKVLLYRVAQEALQNAMRHGKPRQVLLQLSWMSENMQLTIEDDGIGFQPTENKGGLGLRSMQSRVEHLRGQMVIDSGPGEGTSIEVTVPLKN